MEQKRVLLIGKGNHFPQSCIDFIKGFSKKIDLATNWRELSQNVRDHKGSYALACIDSAFLDTPKNLEILETLKKIKPLLPPDCAFPAFHQQYINVLQHIVPYVREQKIPFLVRLNFEIKKLSGIKKEDLGELCKGVFPHYISNEELKIEIARNLAA